MDAEKVLKVKWSNKENDLVIQYPKRCDGALMHYILSDIFIWDGINGKDKGWLNYTTFNLKDELIKRGYFLSNLIKT